MSNNVANVSTGKPKIGGAIHVAPVGTELPTDAKTPLNKSFKCLGYVSTDGLSNDNSSSSDLIKAWGGDTVLTLSKDKKDEFKFALIESLNIDVLKTVFGDANVSGTLEDGIVIRSNNTEFVDKSWVFDLILNGNVLKRIVVQSGVISDVAEIKYKDNEAISYEVKIQAKPGNTEFGFDTHKEYIVKGA